MINDLSNPFFAEFATGVDEALAGAGCVTLLGSTGESTQRQQAVLSSLIEHAPAGIILSPAEGSDGSAIAKAVGRHVPVLVFNRELDGEWDFLAMENQRGARLATEHLIALGHTPVSYTHLDVYKRQHSPSVRPGSRSACQKLASRPVERYRIACSTR